MTNCPFFSKCPLADELLLTNDPELIKEYLHTPGVLTADNLQESYNNRYCKSDYEECARFSVVNQLGLTYLPDDLLPHQTERAQEVINKN